LNVFVKKDTKKALDNTKLLPFFLFPFFLFPLFFFPFLFLSHFFTSALLV
jgi:hypothetical protein